MYRAMFCLPFWSPFSFHCLCRLFQSTNHITILMFENLTKAKMAFVRKTMRTIKIEHVSILGKCDLNLKWEIKIIRFKKYIVFRDTVKEMMARHNSCVLKFRTRRELNQKECGKQKHSYERIVHPCNHITINIFQWIIHIFKAISFNLWSSPLPLFTY